MGIIRYLVLGLVASALGLGGLGSFFSLGMWLVAIGGAFLSLLIYNAVASSSSERRNPA